MIFDTHAHIYPDKIALKATDAIRDFYDIPMDAVGTVSNLLKLSDEAGVTRTLVHSVATTGAQVESINNFILREVKEHSDRLIGFGTMHPDYGDPSKEVDRILAEGLRGIKLHPDFQKFNIDDECMYPLYECVEGRVPVLFHMGDARYGFSKPARLKNILKRFPKLTVIGAHFAGYSEWDLAASVLGDTGIYVDSSSSLAFLTPERAKELVHIYGADRVLFASDFPMWTPADELKRIDALGLTADERDRILYKNACELFGLPEVM